MSRAYIIEVNNRTAAIVTGDERGFIFFSSERMFDSLEGRQFGSAPDAGSRRGRCSMPRPRGDSKLSDLTREG
jgi:hypothetical protein